MFVTRYGEDFTWPEVTGLDTQKSQEFDDDEASKLTRPRATYRNTETLAQLTEENLPPFDLLSKLKQTDRTLESALQDDERARLIRPRVYKAPEISLDDINDPEIRKQIIDFTYSTTTKLAIQESGVDVKRPNTEWELSEQVSRERNEEPGDVMCEDMTVDKLNEWEKKQSRALADVTDSFWKDYRANVTPSSHPYINPQMVTSRISDVDVHVWKSENIVSHSQINTSIPDSTEKIMNLARSNDLRYPFALKPVGYTGFRPYNPIGMKPEKIRLEFPDPMQTCYQVYNRWWERCEQE